MYGVICDGFILPLYGTNNNDYDFAIPRTNGKRQRTETLLVDKEMGMIW